MAGPELTDQEKMLLAEAKARAAAYVKGDAEMERLIKESNSRSALRDVLSLKTGEADALVFGMDGVSEDEGLFGTGLFAKKEEKLTPSEAVAILPKYAPEGDPNQPSAYGGVDAALEKVLPDSIAVERAAGVSQKDAEIYAAKAEAPKDVRQVVDAIVEGTNLSERDLEEAYRAKDVAHALNEAHIAAGDDLDLNKAISTVAKDESKDVSDQYLFAGERASKEMMRAWGYEGEFAENHDLMIQSGYQAKIDADDNIFYIDPTSYQVIDLAGEHVGIFDPFTNVIDTLDHLPDTRAPIGMGTGTYIAEGENVNAVMERPEIALSAWYNLYGDKFVDQVTNEDWEDVLKAAGVSKPTIGALLARADEPTFTTTTSLHYQYLKGDDVNQFIDMPTEDFGAWQKRYEDAGIYKIGKLGSFDPKFVAINEVVMTAANHNYEGDPDGMRKAWDDMVANPQLLDNWFNTRRGGGSSTSRVWRPPAYLAPDYAELSQAVKLTFEDKLGRAPSDAEVELLSTKMKADHRSEFDAQAAAQKMQFFASGGNSAGTVQDVNYAARFQEDFEKKYAAELGTRDKIDMSRNMTQQALGSILSADRAIGY